MTNSIGIIIVIKGLETHNEKNAQDKHMPRVPSRFRSRPKPFVRAPSGQMKRIKKHRALAKMFVTAGTTQAQRDELANGCAVRLIRIAPRRLFDASESKQSALAAVRDGVADALNVDDRDAEEGGLVAWSYEQEIGPYGVRIELTVLALSDLDERKDRSRNRTRGLRPWLTPETVSNPPHAVPASDENPVL